jgi:VanZ family protein
MALCWTALLLVMLLQSSSQPLVGPAAPPGPPTLEREIVLTLGHIVGFAGLTGLWWWALLLWRPTDKALVLAVMIALVIGVFTELAQAAVPDRSASVFDLVVNGLTVSGTAWMIWRRRFPMRLLFGQILIIAVLTACTLTTVPPQTPTAPQSTEEPVFIDGRDNPDSTDSGSNVDTSPNIIDTSGLDDFYIPGCFPRTDWPLYTVQDGDVIVDLAISGGVSVDEFVSANCLANPDLLYVGQQVYVPPAFPPTALPAG